jgi:hypothetical protein
MSAIRPDVNGSVFIDLYVKKTSFDKDPRYTRVVFKNLIEGYKVEMPIRVWKMLGAPSEMAVQFRFNREV